MCFGVEVAAWHVLLHPREVVMRDGQCEGGQGLGYLRAPAEGGAIWKLTPHQGS